VAQSGPGHRLGVAPLHADRFAIAEQRTALSVSKRVEDAISACIIGNESLLLLCRVGPGEMIALHRTMERSTVPYENVRTAARKVNC
jgi:hypothetical protein